jgi:hypothetical protein
LAKLTAMSDHTRNMEAFHKAHGGAMQCCIVRRAHVPYMLLAGATGDVDQLVALKSIQQWLDEMQRREKRERFLCLSCDTTFHARRLPDAFLVVTPFAATDGYAMVTGICRHCAIQDDAKLSQAAIRNMRVIYPDATIAEPGQG